MNDVEKRLESMVPIQGKSDPMQIMFRAGQQSNSRKSDTPWKWATAILTTICFALCISHIPSTNDHLAINQPELESANSPGKNESLVIAQSQEDLNQSTASERRFPAFEIEVKTEDPSTWSALGFQRKQLTSMLREVRSEQREAPPRLTPFTFERQLRNTL